MSAHGARKQVVFVSNMARASSGSMIESSDGPETRLGTWIGKTGVAVWYLTRSYNITILFVQLGKGLEAPKGSIVPELENLACTPGQWSRKSSELVEPREPIDENGCTE